MARREVAAQAALLDPVALLLAQPDVAYNFLYGLWIPFVESSRLRHPANPRLTLGANLAPRKLENPHGKRCELCWELFSGRKWPAMTACTS